MFQFRVYLKGELGKLRNKGDAENFVRAIPSSLLSDRKLSSDLTTLRDQFSDQKKVSFFVDQLTDEDARTIVEFCDKNWRKNGVFDKLRKVTLWEIRDISISKIDIQQAEPRLGQLFRDHNFNLKTLATDSILLQDNAYVNRKAGDLVDYPILLAMRQNEQYRIFDGVHRAIQLVRNGKQYLQLCVPD